MQTRIDAGRLPSNDAEPPPPDTAGALRRFEALIGELQGLMPELVETVRCSQRPPEQRSALATARQAQEDRRRRALLFGEGFFVEPGWDLLVELYVARLEERTLSVSSACIGSFAPLSTALRHISHLEQLGYVAKKPHPSDSRSKYIEITALGAAKMTEFFSGSAAAPRDPAG